MLITAKEFLSQANKIYEDAEKASDVVFAMFAQTQAILLLAQSVQEISWKMKIEV